MDHVLGYLAAIVLGALISLASTLRQTSELRRTIRGLRQMNAQLHDANTSMLAKYSSAALDFSRALSRSARAESVRIERAKASGDYDWKATGDVPIAREQARDQAATRSWKSGEVPRAGG